MKINRFIAIAALALLIVGAMGVISVRTFAQSTNPPAQTQVVEAADNEQAEVADTDDIEEQVGDQNAVDIQEDQNAPDTDNIEEQVGDQSAVDIAGDQNAPDTGNVEEQVGDQNTTDTGAEIGESADGQETAPVGTPAITADQAKAIAEAYLNAGTATQVELDDENGQLIYSVEIGTTDVKVDAMTGAVLGVETGQD